MKRIRDEISLAGKIETITMMELRSRPGEVIEAAMLGKTYLISRNGRAVAVLSALPGQHLAMNVDPKGRVTYVLET